MNARARRALARQGEDAGHTVTRIYVEGVGHRVECSCDGWPGRVTPSLFQANAAGVAHLRAVL